MKFDFSKPNVEVPDSVESENLWREINLFIPETIGITIAVMAAIFGVIIIRVIGFSWLEGIKDKLTESAYVEVANLVGTLNSAILIIVAVPILVLLGFYVYRFLFFMPRKNRYLTARVDRTGAIRLSVDALKDNEMSYSNTGLSEKMKIINPRKHLLANTGKPFIFLFEGDDANADLNIMAGNVSEKSKEINTVNENAIAFGRRLEKYISDKSNDLLHNPLFYMMLAIMAILIIIGFLILKQPEQLQGMLAGLN